MSEVRSNKSVRTRVPKQAAKAQPFDPRAKPFVKWVGGKGQLLPQLMRKLPTKYGRYFEPFIGGGALFFALAPKRAHLFDINEELINTYVVIRDRVEELIKELKKHKYDEEYFYEVRSWDRERSFAKLSPAKRAARFIYLNKTCFNGLYRVNSKGYFNVPFGDYKNPTILDQENLRRCSQALKGAAIEVASYLSVESRVRKGDFVYFDPPYAPLSATSNFTTYTAVGFEGSDQQQLRDLVVRLSKKGVFVMLSNSSAPLILDLYANFAIELVDANRSINSRGQARGPVKEVLVTNF